ncbi:MAG: DUF916 domain-containing protein [Actinomycetota bacterium]|nr:DUF916 domain-containing protein [Actinomycetota bacterium]
MLSAVYRIHMTKRRAAAVLAVALFCTVAAPEAGARSATAIGSAVSGLNEAHSASTAPAGFGIQPASATAIQPRPEFLYGGGPGAVITDHVALVNIGPVPLTLDLYPADAALTSDGSFALLLANQKQTGVGAWISIDGPSQVVIAPRTIKGPTIKIFAFSTRIPRNASPGDHVGAVIVSLHTAADPTKGSSIGLNQRVGARVYVRVSGAVHPALSVDGLRAKYTSNGVLNPLGTGNVKVTYTVRNTGNVILSGTQSVKVSGLFGSRSAVKLPAVPALLPGASVGVTATVRGVFPQFLLSARATVHPIAQVGEIDPGLKNASAAVTIWAIPWALIVLILLVIAGAGYWWWRRTDRLRRTHDGRHGPGTAARRVPVG